MKNESVNYCLSSFAGIFTAIQQNEVFQWISLGLTIFSVILSICYTIYKWYKKAHQDGVVTPEELEELADEIGNMKDKLEKRK